MLARAFCCILAAIALLSRSASAQTTEFTLTDEGGFEKTFEPDPESDEGILAAARRHLAADEPAKAKRILKQWLRENERTANPWLPQAYLLRGDARAMLGSEYKALYDYESVIQDFPGSQEFLPAVERELAIALDYTGGLRKKFLGLRIEDAKPTGEELLIRVQERVPDSDIAETAAIELADYYFRRRELELARDMYGIFSISYPRSRYTRRARLNQIFANVATYKGPEYDASGLVEAEELIGRYIDTYGETAAGDGITQGLTTWIEEQQAAQRLETARWYLARNDPSSARFTIDRLLRNHPATTAARDGYDIAVEEGWIEPEQEAGSAGETRVIIPFVASGKPSNN